MNEGVQPVVPGEFGEFWTSVIGVVGEYRPEHEATLNWKSGFEDKDKSALPPFSAETGVGWSKGAKTGKPQAQMGFRGTG